MARRISHAAFDRRCLQREHAADPIRMPVGNVLVHSGRSVSLMSKPKFSHQLPRCKSDIRHTSGYHAFLLYTLDCLGSCNTLQHGISAESFPDATAARHASQWSHCRPEKHMDSFHTRFTAVKASSLVPADYDNVSLCDKEQTRKRTAAYMRSLFHVAPTVTPAGKAVAWSAKRRPSGPSWRHREGKPTSTAGPEA